MGIQLGLSRCGLRLPDPSQISHKQGYCFPQLANWDEHVGNQVPLVHGEHGPISVKIIHANLDITGSALQKLINSVVNLNRHTLLLSLKKSLRAPGPKAPSLQTFLPLLTEGLYRVGGF